MRIALVHDWRAEVGGDKRVLDALRDLLPHADVFYLSQRENFYGLSKFLLPMLPIRAESLDLSDYDLVISTGSIFAKGLILRPKTYHINYCHSPTRQVWDLSHAYHRKIFQHFLRIWDRQASTRVDQFVANSRHVQERIKKFYRRDSLVIYPPVELAGGLSSRAYRSPTGRGSSVAISAEIDDRFAESLPANYFLIVSRLYHHKNIDIAVRAFNKLGWPLVIIGDGPERARLARLTASNVHLLGSLPDSLLATHYSLSTAFILPQEEDFGIAPIEAMSYGKPVLALRRGGALEYVQEGVNGLFFDDPHEAVLADGVRRIRDITFDPEVVKATAQKFSCQKFQSSFSNLINQIGH